MQEMVTDGLGYLEQEARALAGLTVLRQPSRASSIATSSDGSAISTPDPPDARFSADGAHKAPKNYRGVGNAQLASAAEPDQIWYNDPSH